MNNNPVNWVDPWGLFVAIGEIIPGLDFSNNGYFNSKDLGIDLSNFGLPPIPGPNQEGKCEKGNSDRNKNGIGKNWNKFWNIIFLLWKLILGEDDGGGPKGPPKNDDRPPFERPYQPRDKGFPWPPYKPKL